MSYLRSLLYCYSLILSVCVNNDPGHTYAAFDFLLKTGRDRSGIRAKVDRRNANLDRRVVS